MTSIKKIMKYFLEIPGLFNKIIEYKEKLAKENEPISNIVQGDLYKRKYSLKKNGCHVLPINIYFDEVETGNGMGSHAGKNKFGTVYWSIASLPHF